MMKKSREKPAKGFIFNRVGSRKTPTTEPTANIIFHESINSQDLPPPPVPPAFTTHALAGASKIPDMSKLAVVDIPKIQKPGTPEIGHIPRAKLASEYPSGHLPTVIEQSPGTEICVVDEGTPRQCDYLGSFEVKQFTSPEERGQYITQQLYQICSGRDGGGKEKEGGKGGDGGEQTKAPGVQGTKSWPVCLVLTLSGIKVCDPSNLKNQLQMFALRRISFSTAIPSLNVFAISAREPGQSHDDQFAHVFRTDNAEEINQIVGQAFKQAYTLERNETKSVTPTPPTASQTSMNQATTSQTSMGSATSPARPTVAPTTVTHQNPNPHDKFEHKIMSQLLANSKPRVQISNHNSSAMVRQKSFKRSSLPGSAASMKDASSEFFMGARFRPASAHSSPAHSRQNSGGITYTYSTAGSSGKQSTANNSGTKIGYETSGYESHSLSSNSSNQSQPNGGQPASGGGQANKSLERKLLQKRQQSNHSYAMLPQSQWHQPDLHPDTARNLLIKMPLGCYFIVGSHSPLNLMIRGDKQIYQIGIVITNKGYHLLLTSKERRKQQNVPVFGTLPALVYHYTHIDPEASPLPTPLLRTAHPQNAHAQKQQPVPPGVPAKM